MEAENLEQKVSWLDEQRRRDLSILEGLEQRLSELESQIASQREQSKGVSADLSRLSALAARIEEFDDSLHKHRQEVSRQLRSQSEMREERDDQLDEIRKADQESVSNRIAEMHEQIQSLKPLEDAIENRKQEELRLSRELDGIAKNVEDLADRFQDQKRAISSLEESRRSEGQRVAEAQSDINSVREQLESIKGNYDLVEDRLRRIETQVGEIETVEEEQRKTIDAWRENQARKFVDFEREWAGWEERFQQFEEMADDLDERMIKYAETFRNTKQIQSELEKVVERLERRINEITEMQRLSEDRFKQEWRSFQSDDTKRWNTYKLTSEERWREHERQHGKIKEQIESLESASDVSEREIDALQEGADRRLRELLTLARQWVQNEESSS